MFHIKQLELVHWDYWRRFNLPLDAQIITIVGPNGSGKTTLLDALRTLFGLRCSGKRDFRRYVRRANRSFAWIRAVVANRPGSTGKRPFFPCLKDEVTLACRIRRAGGDWTRDYAIADGDVPIEALEANEDKAVEWVGYRDYQSRLAWGGLTPAIAKVLALEQGDTDKLCEYSPKALLELVFDVFGDKEVLDNYDLAREEQNNAERELAALGLDLDRLRAQAEAKRLEADRFLEWKQLDDEARALAAEIVPRLEATELARDIGHARSDIARDKDDQQRCSLELADLQTRIRSVEAEKAAADAERKAARSADLEAEKAHLAAHDEVRDAEKLLAERSALRTRLAREAGDAAVDLEAAYAKADARLLHLQRQEREAIAAFEERTNQLRATRDSRGSPGDPEVNRFRARLKEAGIAHRALSEIVEVTDPGWQGALEAVLRPYRHVLLLEREQDRHAAWGLGEQERFRHFIVPELEPAPPATRGSLAEVIRFADAVPRWLADLLGRAGDQRVGVAQQLAKGIGLGVAEVAARTHQEVVRVGRAHVEGLGELDAVGLDAGAEARDVGQGTAEAAGRAAEGGGRRRRHGIHRVAVAVGPAVQRQRAGLRCRRSGSQGDGRGQVFELHGGWLRFARLGVIDGRQVRGRAAAAHPRACRGDVVRAATSVRSSRHGRTTSGAAAAVAARSSCKGVLPGRVARNPPRPVRRGRPGGRGGAGRGGGLRQVALAAVAAALWSAELLQLLQLLQLLAHACHAGCVITLDQQVQRQRRMARHRQQQQLVPCQRDHDLGILGDQAQRFGAVADDRMQQRAFGREPLGLALHTAVCQHTLTLDVDHAAVVHAADRGAAAHQLMPCGGPGCAIGWGGAARHAGHAGHRRCRQCRGGGTSHGAGRESICESFRAQGVGTS